MYGSTVEYEPSDYKDYSDGRPDVVRHRPEGLWAGDVKVKDPIGSSPAACGVRGVYVGFGNTAPGAHDEVLGAAHPARRPRRARAARAVILTQRCD